ncbi:threonine--tRNA ligase [Phytohabitans suffuscus]|uniref:Threonine--tRNA ligase n=2 Tax=Phytohabitans suffuscus TaxID=624315 RepID=A0A6F8YGT6_9ACTN|nr:threonine--tRNA ligase [Phytohabitans suffuscus]BCB85253.1 threonine--tRNA ligase [Phytohabitans suffuscus]
MIDHRKLGRELELFHSDPLAGAGLPIWLPAGAAARHAVEEYIREEERRAGYQHVYSPPVAKRQLYELSGHLPHFAEDMFPPMRLSADDEFALRPALCPHHALVYRSRGRSYRDLPLRIAELGGMYRAERSGVLGGLSRVRSIWLNDGHIFCPLDRAGEEVAAVLEMIRRAHAALGVRPAGFRLSLHGAGDKYVDNPPMWERTEDVLRGVLKDLGVSYVEAPGEAAFYGPKIDVQVVDVAGREMTLSTVQLDFHQAARFELSYVDRDGARRRPVIVHRSVVGSMERLFAYLIEVHEGAFPAWYAPVQLEVLPVGDVAVERFSRSAIAAGLRAEVSREGTLAARIRDAARRKVPFVAVVGPREATASAVNLRIRDTSDQLLPEPEALAALLARARP